MCKAKRKMDAFHKTEGNDIEESKRLKKEFVQKELEFFQDLWIDGVIPLSGELESIRLGLHKNKT